MTKYGSGTTRQCMYVCMYAYYVGSDRHNGSIAHFMHSEEVRHVSQIADSACAFCVEKRGGGNVRTCRVLGSLSIYTHAGQAWLASYIYFLSQAVLRICELFYYENILKSCN